MKRVLFFATAAAVAMTSFAPFAFADTSAIDNLADNVSVDIDVTTKLAGTEESYSSHTSSQPLYGSTKTTDGSDSFLSKATLKTANVKTAWNEYVDAGLAYAIEQGYTGYTRDNVIKAAKLTAEFTISITPNENVKSESGDTPQIQLVDDTATFFKWDGNVTNEDGTYKYTLTTADTFDNMAFDAYLTSGKDFVITIDPSTMNNVSDSAYEIKADFTGTVNIAIASKSWDVTFNGGDTEYVRLAAIVEEAQPTAVAPVETVMPTYAPDESIEVNIGDKIVSIDPDSVSSENPDYSGYTDDNLTYVKVDVYADDNDTLADYGDDYVAVLTKDNKTIILTEEDYTNIIGGHLTSDDLSNEVAELIGSDSLKETLGNITLVADKEKVASYSIIPAYSVSNASGVPEAVPSLGTGDKIEVETPATPTPTAKPTTRPSTSHGSGGGGSHTVVTATPTATAAPTGTTAPAPVVTSGTDTGAELNYTDHFAYIIGYEDGTIRPNNNITRAEVATIFFRLFTNQTREEFWSKENSFTDVNDTEWYNNAISTAAKAGIVNGYDDGTFLPNKSITRAEFATIVSKFIGGTYSGSDKFSDISGHWAEANINKAAELGWITGYEDGTFAPDKNITRAEAMTIINRATYRLIDNSGLKDETSWPDISESDWYYAQVIEATESHEYEPRAIGSYEQWIGLNPDLQWDKLETKTSNVDDVLVDESPAVTVNPTVSTEAPEATEAPAATEEATEAPTATPAA